METKQLILPEKKGSNQLSMNVPQKDSASEVTIKGIRLCSTPPTPKTIKPKEIKKRKVINTDRWTKTIGTCDISESQILLENPAKSAFIYQQIKNKIHSYRSQDIEKNILDEENLADLSGVLMKLSDANYTCYYCKDPVQLLYENVREPKQWTLERIDNKRGHVLDNVEIACLSCNLRRRTMKVERYVMTKNIRVVVKSQSS
jgi:hypothetical protein